MRGFDQPFTWQTSRHYWPPQRRPRHERRGIDGYTVVIPDKNHARTVVPLGNVAWLVDAMGRTFTMDRPMMAAWLRQHRDTTLWLKGIGK